MINEDRLEKALTYLATTDADCASLKANVARTEYLAKRHEALVFQIADGPIDARKAEAKASGEVASKWEEHFKAIEAYEAVRAKRETEVIVVETWRSMNANRRQAQ
jgi:hypothetical protein